MRQAIISATERFRLKSCGNGVSYALTRLSDDREVFVQGDDALAFEAELDGYRHNPGWSEDDALYEIFSVYADIATEA